MQDHQQEYAVKTMGRVLAVAESGDYAWCKREPSRRQRANEPRTEHIRQTYQQGRHVSGSPRVRSLAAGTRDHVWEAPCGAPDAPSQLARYLQKRRRICTTDSHHSDPVTPHLLQRDFTAPARCRKWLTEITAVWTGEGWL